MSTKKEKKTIFNRRLRSEYVVEQSDEGELSDDISSTRRVHYNSTLFKTSTTPRKGRELERTRSRPSTKVDKKSPTFSDNSEEEIEYEDTSIILAQNMIEGKAEFCKEKLKIENNFCKSKYISETLRKDFKEKVQRVFKEIYTFYYNKGNHKTIESIEKEISMLKTCINERFRINRSEYLHIFAKLLRDNISFYINSFKDKITEENVHKKLKKKYTDLKNSIHYDLNVEMKENLNSKQKQEKYSKCLTEIMNFCKDNTSGILSIINDLNKTYLFLLKACSHLILIFEFPLNEMNKEFKTSINLENLHKEEFFNVIINDDFIKSLIIEVKNKELPLFLNLRPVIVKIEGDIANSTKDMKNLKLLILDLDKEEKEPDDLKDHDLSSLTDPRSLNQLIINTSKNNNRLSHCINIDCKNKLNSKEKNGKLQIDYLGLESIPKPENSNLFSSKEHSMLAPNISKVKLNHHENNLHKNIDELVEYIIADDSKNSKKQNKKSNKNQNNKKKKEDKINQTNNSIVLTPEIDREVEEFKNKLKIETVHASCIRKIKPKLSMEWITMITTGTTINSISSLSI